SLPTPDVVKTVALGPAGVIEGTKVKTFVDLSTTGPRVAKEVAAGLARKGITAVDAPVSGGPTGAEKGTLAMMIACPRVLADEAEALGVPMIVGNAVRQMMGIGKAAMGPDADITEFVKPIEQWAGVEVGKKT